MTETERDEMIEEIEGQRQCEISREREGATSLSADGADEYWSRRLR